MVGTGKWNNLIIPGICPKALHCPLWCHFEPPLRCSSPWRGFAIAVEYDNAGSEMFWLVTDPSSVKPSERSRFASER
jgi:hypothetical protein